MVDVPVEPSVLVWARNERGLSPSEASERLNITESELSEIESGNRVVTLGLVERMARSYSMPLASLLMPSPPVSRSNALKDFRSFDGVHIRVLSPKTMLAISHASNYLELLADLKESAPKFFPRCSVPSESLSADPRMVAAEERQRLAGGVIGISESHTPRDRFLRMRELVESQGIFTYQLKFGDDHTRGISLWDENEIPIIIINASESDYPAKIFTLWHEYAHIVLRTGGISDQNCSDHVERFCNLFAAHFLMPMSEFKGVALQIKAAGKEWCDWHVARLANLFGVSKSAVALHLEEAGLVREGFYAALKALWGLRKNNLSAGRSEYNERVANRLGSKHILTVISAYHHGILNRLDTVEYLGIKPNHFAAVEREALDRRGAYERALQS
mgnify:CR=1 FL=1